MEGGDGRESRTTFSEEEDNIAGLENEERGSGVEHVATVLEPFAEVPEESGNVHDGEHGRIWRSLLGFDVTGKVHETDPGSLTGDAAADLRYCALESKEERAPDARTENAAGRDGRCFGMNDCRGRDEGVEGELEPGDCIELICKTWIPTQCLLLTISTLLIRIVLVSVLI